MISGAGAAGAAGAVVAALSLAAEVSAGGAALLAAAAGRSCCGALHADAIRSAPMTTAVRRMGNKSLLDMENSVQISGTA
jgi:hypothetical protein